MASLSRRRHAPASIHGIAALLWIAVGACAPNQVSFAIIQNQLPQPGGASGQCTVSSDPTSQVVGTGTLDLLVRDNYSMTPLYQSELEPYRDSVAGRPETRGIFVDGARIQLFAGSTDGQPLADEFTAVSDTYIPPSTTSGEGRAAGGLEIIPSVLGQQLAATQCEIGPVTATCPVPQVTSHPLLVVARITPFGHTMGGTQLDGATFQYPINVCCGCLISFPADADNAMVAGPDCSQGIATAMACTQGEDTPLDCRSCSGANAFCRPSGSYGTAACVR